MKKWINSAKFESTMRVLDKSVYEKQIANMVGDEKNPISEAQADYMQNELDKLREGFKMQDFNDRVRR